MNFIGVFFFVVTYALSSYLFHHGGEHTVQRITSNLVLEVINKDVKSFVQGEPMNRVKVANLWVTPSTVTPQASITMIVGCQSPQEYNLTFCFSMERPDTIDGKSPIFESGKVGTVTFRIDSGSINKEKWYYVGKVNELNKSYDGVIQPVHSNDSASTVDLVNQSGYFVDKISNAKQLKIEICLENAMCGEGVFDLDSFDQGLKELNNACVRFKTNQ